MCCEKGKGNHNREADSGVIEAWAQREGQFEFGI